MCRGLLSGYRYFPLLLCTYHCIFREIVFVIGNLTLAEHTRAHLIFALFIELVGHGIVNALAVCFHPFAEFLKSKNQKTTIFRAFVARFSLQKFIWRTLCSSSFSCVAVSLGVKTHTFFHNIEENNTKNQFVRLNCFCRILAHFFNMLLLLNVKKLIPIKLRISF